MLEIIRDVELEADIEAQTPQPPETSANQPIPEPRQHIVRRSFNLKEGTAERKEKEKEKENEKVIDFHKSMI